MKMKRSLALILAFILAFASIITVSAEETATQNLAAEVMTKEVFEASNGLKMPYRLYVPEDYDANKEYSFLLFLHGAGNRGDDNNSQVSVNTGLLNRIIGGEKVTYDGTEIDTSKEFIIIAPQCAKDAQWVDTPWDKMPDPSYSLGEVAISEHMTAVVELINEAKEKYNLDETRLYATGLSMGGFGVWDLLARYPGLFAAAIPMGGAGDISKAAEIAETPVWTFHQILDKTVSDDGTVAMVKAITEAQGEVKYTPYFDAQHNAWTKGYAEEDLLQWLYSHTTSRKKIAFVGDSITYGAGIPDPIPESFPSVVKARIGKSYEIANFGKPAMSALYSSVKPYNTTEEYTKSLEYDADILFIMFGTNDIKNENWDAGKDNFVPDYVDMINKYKEKNPELEVFVGIPPRIFKENVYGERSPKILEEEGIPGVYKVIEETGATAIDFFTPTKDSPELFGDYLHPNAAGYRVFADIAMDVMFEGEDLPETIALFGASDWAKEEVALAFASGIMPQKLGFNYTQDITREEFCEMVVNMLPDNLEASREAKFADTENTAIAYAYGIGVVNGFSDEEFAPDKNITREEMAAMIQRACAIIAPDAAFEKAEYPDSSEISDWAVDSVDYVYGLGVMKDDENGNIMPKANTTREQATLLVYRAYCKANCFGK